MIPIDLFKSCNKPSVCKKHNIFAIKQKQSAIKWGMLIYIHIYTHLYQIANIHWIIEKASRKTSTSALLAMPKPLTMWITTNCGKFFKRWEYQTMLPASWETCMQVKNRVRTGRGTTDWFQTGKRVYQGYILSLCLFNLCKVHHAKRCPGWSTSWKQDCQKKHQSQICRWHHPYDRKWRTKKPLDESESGEWKSWLKAQHSENEDHGIWSHHFMGSRWGNSGNSVRLYIFGLQNDCRWWLQPWN